MLNEFVGWAIVHPPMFAIYVCIVFLGAALVGGTIGSKVYDIFIK